MCRPVLFAPQLKVNARMLIVGAAEPSVCSWHRRAFKRDECNIYRLNLAQANMAAWLGLMQPCFTVQLTPSCCCRFDDKSAAIRTNDKQLAVFP
jgi:hypothetical protein